MLPSIFFTIAALVFSSLGTVQGIRCKEGINITAFEIPFYHWSERECTGNSRCFTQEIGVNLGAPVNFRYGGCISTAYSGLFSCQKLFGKESNLDPTVLLDLLADADDWIDRIVRDIKANVTHEMKILFSKGDGTEDLIEGGFLLYEMMGYNMEKVRQLKEPLAKLIELEITLASTGDILEYRRKFPKVKLEFEQAVEKLDTTEPEITAEIYKFLGNFMDEGALEAIKNSKLQKLSIEKLPGLYKSMLSEYSMSSRIDTLFEMLGAIDATKPEKTASDVIRIFRSSVNMSEESMTYIDPFLNTVPEFARNLSSHRPGYTIEGVTMQWIAAIMREYGGDNEVASSLGDAIVRFITTVSPGGESYPKYELDMIRSLPRLFYRFFPAKKSEIETAFSTVIKGLESFNYENIAVTPLMEKTNLSNFIMSLIDNIRPDLYSRSPGLKMKTDRIIINLSKTFYNAMTEKYTDKLDVFFMTLDSEFGGFPAIDGGHLITSLVTKLGGEVPSDVEPFLNNMQNIINTMVSGKFDKFYKALMKMVHEYKQAFPDSKFPDIARRYLENVNASVIFQLQTDSCLAELDWSEPREVLAKKHRACVEEKAIKRKLHWLKLMKSVYSVETDLFFAVFEAAGFDSDEMIKNISAFSKPLATYLQLFRVIDPDDVKEILSDYATWFINLFDEGDNYKFDNFLYAMNATTAKITSKLGNFMKDLRHVHAPEYCKYLTCDVESCNSHEAIEAVSPISQDALRGIKPTNAVTEKTEEATRPSGASKSYSTNLNVVLTMYLVSWFV